MTDLYEEIAKVDNSFRMQLSQRKTVKRVVLDGRVDEVYEFPGITIRLDFSISDIFRYNRKFSDLSQDKKLKEVLDYILAASLRASDMKNDFVLSSKEVRDLPYMFSRYFVRSYNNNDVHVLKYDTIERVKVGLRRVIQHIERTRAKTRHCYVPIWYPDDNNRLNEMVPSLIGFHVQFNESMVGGDMFVHVSIRSCDINFLHYDLWYFLNLMSFISSNVPIYVDRAALVVHIFNLHMTHKERAEK